MAETRREIKRRRTPAEKQLADKILAEGSNHPPDSQAAAQAKAYADATVASKRFESHNRTPEGYTIHRFHVEGESLAGVLGECNGQSGYGESTYPIVLDDGSIVCVAGNRRLVKAFKRGKFTFQRIRITYKGRLHTHGGHYEKVYLVEPAPIGKAAAER